MRPQERPQQARGPRVDELHPPARGRRRALRGDRLRHPQRRRGQGHEEPGALSHRGRAQAPGVPGGPGQGHGGVGPDLDRDQVRLITVLERSAD